MTSTLHRLAAALAVAATLGACAAAPEPAPDALTLLPADCRALVTEIDLASEATAGAREELRRVWKAILPFVVVGRYIDASHALSRAEQHERDLRATARWLGCNGPPPAEPTVGAYGDGLRLRPAVLPPV